MERADLVVLAGDEPVVGHRFEDDHLGHSLASSTLSPRSFTLLHYRAPTAPAPVFKYSLNCGSAQGLDADRRGKPLKSLQLGGSIRGADPQSGHALGMRIRTKRERYARRHQIDSLLHRNRLVLKRAA
jgi:hypothetical protein